MLVHDRGASQVILDEAAASGPRQVDHCPRTTPQGFRNPQSICIQVSFLLKQPRPGILLVKVRNSADNGKMKSQKGKMWQHILRNGENELGSWPSQVIDTLTINLVMNSNRNGSFGSRGPTTPPFKMTLGRVWRLEPRQVNPATDVL